MMDRIAYDECFAVATKHSRVLAQLTRLKAEVAENEKRICLLQCQVRLQLELAKRNEIIYLATSKYNTTWRATSFAQKSYRQRYREFRRHNEEDDYLPKYEESGCITSELFAQYLNFGIKRGSLAKFDVSDCIASIKSQLNKAEAQRKNYQLQREMLYRQQFVELKHYALHLAFDIDSFKAACRRVKAYYTLVRCVADFAARYYLLSMGANAEVIIAAQQFLDGLFSELT